MLRIRNQNRIRKDPKILAGSGSEINISDPKQICKKEPYNQTKKQVISDNYFFKHFQGIIWSEFRFLQLSLQVIDLFLGCMIKISP